MKKIILALSIIITNTCFAENLIYCPSSIQCLKDDITSCFIEGENPSIWNKKDLIGYGIIQEGSYKFSSASGGLDLSSQSHLQSICTYTVTKRKIKYQINIYKSYEEIKAKITDESQWIGYSGGVIWCNSENPTDCPMTLQVNLKK